MNETMKQALDRQLSTVEWTAEDAQAVCLRMSSEVKPMKRKWPAGLVLAAAAMLLTTVALAMASQAGMLDFMHHFNAYIPGDAQTYVKKDVAVFDHELVTVQVRESYYDGRTLRLALDITPKEEGVLLLGTNVRMDSPWQELICIDDADIDPADTRTVRDVAAGYEKAYRVSVEEYSEIRIPSFAALPGCGDCVFDPETGVLTWYYQQLYNDDLSQRTVDFEVIMLQTYGTEPMISGYIEYWQTLEVTSAAETPTYEGLGPVDYPQAEARISRLLLEVKPQEIYYTIEFTAPEKQLTPHITSSAVLFEFLGAEAPNQKLPYGLVGTYGVRRVGEDQYVQWGTLGRDELHESYQLRAHDADDFTRYETMTIPVMLVDGE